MMHSKAPVDANPGGYTRCEDTQKSHSEPAQPYDSTWRSVEAKPLLIASGSTKRIPRAS